MKKTTWITHWLGFRKSIFENYIIVFISSSIIGRDFIDHHAITLWIVVVNEQRWTCSELVINCGPDSSHFSGKTKSLHKSVDQMNRKIPIVVICLLTKGISWIALWDFFLDVLSSLAVLSHPVSNCHLSKTSQLSIFAMPTTNFWTEHLHNQSLVVPPHYLGILWVQDQYL